MLVLYKKDIHHYSYCDITQRNCLVYPYMTPDAYVS